MSKMIAGQVHAGDEYRNIKQTICILITDYELITENRCYHNQYYLYDKTSGSQFSDLLAVNVLELPKLPRKSDGSTLWEWMRFLRIEHVEEFDMLSKKDPQVERAMDILKALSEDENTRYLYEQREKARRDWEAMQRSAILDGREEGLKIGLQTGRIEGRKEGREEGREEGRIEGCEEGRSAALIQVVQNASRNNISIDDIVKLTGLTYDEVKKMI